MTIVLFYSFILLIAYNIYVLIELKQIWLGFIYLFKLARCLINKLGNLTDII